MPLILANKSLFGDTDDSLKPRWQQSGSTPVTINSTTAHGTIYTVTAGKKLYITNVFTILTTDVDECTLRDGGAGGTVKFSQGEPSINVPYQYNFSTPLQFNTNVFYDGIRPNITTLIGWEE